VTMPDLGAHLAGIALAPRIDWLVISEPEEYSLLLQEAGNPEGHGRPATRSRRHRLFHPIYPAVPDGSGLPRVGSMLAPTFSDRPALSGTGRHQNRVIGVRSGTN